MSSVSLLISAPRSDWYVLNRILTLGRPSYIRVSAHLSGSGSGRSENGLAL
jgi:hypothetical protein